LQEIYSNTCGILESKIRHIPHERYDSKVSFKTMRGATIS